MTFDTNKVHVSMQNLAPVCTTMFFRRSATTAVVESVVSIYNSLRSSLRHPHHSCKMPKKNTEVGGRAGGA